MTTYNYILLASHCTYNCSSYGGMASLVLRLLPRKIGGGGEGSTRLGIAISKVGSCRMNKWEKMSLLT